jgi:DNA polymerase-3 subunit delta'
LVCCMAVRAVDGRTFMDTREAYLLLKRAFLAGRLAQGYLVIGTPRVEGRALVEQMSQLLLCTSSGDARPCGKCRGCRTAAPGKHPDIFWIEPQLKTRKIGVEEIRAFRQGMMGTSFISGGWKVGVVVAADRMNDSSANAFLKALEEPPARSVFFLLTDAPHALLATVVSRCQTVRLSQDTQPLSVEIQAEIAAALCSGDASPIGVQLRVGRFAALFRAMQDKAETEVKAALESDPSWASLGVDERKDVLNARKSARYREMRDGMILFLFEWYRDILCLASGSEPALLMHREHEGALRTLASRHGARAALRSMRVVERTRSRLERNLTEVVVFEEAIADMV